MMHWLEFKPQLWTCSSHPLPFHSLPVAPVAMPQRHQREMEKSARATKLTAKLWAILILACGLAWLTTTTQAMGMATRSQLALGWLALAAEDPMALFATESEFWASLLVSGLHCCLKVTKDQTHRPHVQRSLSTPLRVSLGSRGSIPSEQCPSSSTQGSLCLFPWTTDIFSIGKLSRIPSGT